MSDMFTVSSFDRLIDFQQNAKRDTFQSIFGESLGAHLWGEFLKHEQQLISFVRYLDTENLELLASHLSQEEREPAHA